MNERVTCGVRMSRLNRALVITAAAVCLSLVVQAQPSASTVSGSWGTRDVGTTGGRATQSGSSFLLDGTGGDIWSSSDRFRFVHQTLSGDGDIVARVTSLRGGHHWTKAGVMMRETLNANSRHAAMLVSADRGFAFQRRAGAGDLSLHTAGGSGRAPGWVRVSRRGNTFRGYRSNDGLNWTLVGSQSISMGSTIQVGLVVSSHAPRGTATGTFDQVKVTRAISTGTSTTTSTSSGTAATSSSSTSTRRSLRVLHWNIQHGRLDNGKYNIEKQADWIASFRPDLVSLNEVHHFSSGHGNEDQARRFAEMLTRKTGTRWYFHQRVATGGSRGQGNAILSRFPIQATSHCQLSSSRNAVHATVTVHGRTVNIWSTHLSVNWAGSGLTDRQAQALRTSEIRNLMACARNYPESRILAGDFNTQASTSEIGLVTRDYVDVWPAAKSLGQARNYSGNCDGCTRRSRIDFIFHSKSAGHLVLRSAQIFDTRDARGTKASDHKPLLAVYDVR